MKRIILMLHGIKDKSAAGPLRLRAGLESAGYIVRVANYGMFFLRGIIPIAWNLFNVPLARMVAGFVELLDSEGYEVTLVGHSNGGAIACKATEFGAPAYALVLIDAAVERGVKVGKQVKWILNFHNPGDALLYVSSVLPLHPWGLGGALGLDREDPRVQNIDLTDRALFGTDIRGHGGPFDPKVADVFAAKLAEVLEQTRQIQPLKLSDNQTRA